MAPRTHDIQVPGAATPAPAGDQQPATQETQAAERTEKAPVAARRPQKAATPAPAGRMAFKDVPAADIDPSTLRAPVLSRDGWVCPSKAPTDPREGA